MAASVTEVSILITESESTKRWSAWFAVSYSDGTISTWDMEIPAEAKWIAPGIPDYLWVAMIMKVITEREPDTADILVTHANTAKPTIHLHGEHLAAETGEEFRPIRELRAETEVPGQLPLFGDVSRETHA